MPLRIIVFAVGVVTSVVLLVTWVASDEPEDESIAIVLGGDLSRTLAPPNLTRLLALEAELARLEGVDDVVGPATFINRKIEQAKRDIEGEGAAEAAATLVRHGSIGAPSLANRSFVDTLVYGAGITPRPQLRRFFPDARHAIVVVRPSPGLDESALLELERQIEILAGQAGLRGAPPRVSTEVA